MTTANDSNDVDRLLAELAAVDAEMLELPAIIETALDAEDGAALGRLRVRQEILEAKRSRIAAEAIAAAEAGYEQRREQANRKYVAARKHTAEVVAQAKAMVTEARKAEGSAQRATWAIEWEQRDLIRRANQRPAAQPKSVQHVVARVQLPANYSGFLARPTGSRVQ